jgi:glycerate dehydrogenase
MPSPLSEGTLKIVFLDAATADLGDVDLTALTQEGSYQSLTLGSRSRIPKKVCDAQVVITNKVLLGPSQMDFFSNLKLICVAATGVNNIDLPAAQNRGIGVANVAGYSTNTVVEHTMMFLLACSHRLLEHHRAVREGRWSRSPYFTLLEFPFSDLAGKTLGVVGYGHIGSRVAGLARAFGMKVLPAKLSPTPFKKNIKRYPLSKVIRESDFITLHCALSSRTRGLINRQRLKLMKPTAYLLNLARGPVVVEKDVVWALEKKHIAGYATDVTEEEPIPKNHPFLKKTLRNKILLSPHIAWASRESRQRLIDEIGLNISAFKKGKRRNRLD